MTHALLIRVCQIFSTSVTGRILSAFALLLAGGNTLALADNAVDDGWRRTKDGWENIAHWHLSAAQRELPSDVPTAPAVLSPAAEQLLTAAHPVLIALSIVILGAIALLTITPVAELARIQTHGVSERNEVRILVNPAT